MGMITRSVVTYLGNHEAEPRQESLLVLLQEKLS